MKLETQSLLIIKTRHLTMELERGGKADMVRTRLLLNELRRISDDADTDDIPLELFAVLAPELRKAVFDTFLGLMANNLGMVFQDVQPHKS